MRLSKKGACDVKLLGAVLLFFVCAMLGFWKAGQYVKRSEELRQLRGSLSALETEITYGATPLHRACQQIGERESGAVGRFFTRVSERLYKSDGRSAFECWQQTLTEMKSELSLKEQDRTILTRLGSKLGLSDKRDQLHHLRLAQTTLEVEEAHAIKERDKYEKMYRNLGVLAGALLVILMY